MMGSYGCCLASCGGCLVGARVLPRQCFMMWLHFQRKAVFRTGAEFEEVEVQILRLSGEPLCNLRVQRSCTVGWLKHKIQVETRIPQVRQRLVHDTAAAPLEDIVRVADVSGSGEIVLLHLIQISKVVQDCPHAKPTDATSIFRALKSRNEERALQLLSLEDLPGINEVDLNGWTVLHIAASAGLAEVCQIILERPDFTLANSEDISGLTALHCASCSGRLSTVLVLLASESFTAVHFADGQIDRNGVGWSAHDLASRFGYDGIVQAIDEYSERETAKQRLSLARTS